jgi:hypothetical protein
VWEAVTSLLRSASGDGGLTTQDFGAFPPVAAAFVGVTLLVGVLGFVGHYLEAWVSGSRSHEVLLGDRTEWSGSL